MLRVFVLISALPKKETFFFAAVGKRRRGGTRRFSSRQKDYLFHYSRRKLFPSFSPVVLITPPPFLLGVFLIFYLFLFLLIKVLCAQFQKERKSWVQFSFFFRISFPPLFLSSSSKVNFPSFFLRQPARFARWEKEREIERKSPKSTKQQHIIAGAKE